MKMWVFGPAKAYFINDRNIPHIVPISYFKLNKMFIYNITKMYLNPSLHFQQI